MFQLQLKITTVELDGPRYMAAMKKELENQARQAAAEFAKAALSRIPIRTGFVSGAFGTLTDLIGANARFNPIVSLVRKAISVFRRSRAANNQIEFYYGSGEKVLKTTTSGRQFTTPTTDILKWEGDTLVFKYDVDITYFAINDNVGGHAPTAPWGAFKAGEEAFNAYMQKDGLNKLPKFEDYLIEKTTRVG